MIKRLTLCIAIVGVSILYLPLCFSGTSPYFPLTGAPATGHLFIGGLAALLKQTDDGVTYALEKY